MGPWLVALNRWWVVASSTAGIVVSISMASLALLADATLRISPEHPAISLSTVTSPGDPAMAWTSSTLIPFWMAVNSSIVMLGRLNH